MSKVVRIKSFTLPDFIAGLGDDTNLDGEFFNSADGWTPFQSSYPGLLSVVSNPTNIDSGQTKIDSNILAMVPRTGSYFYCLATNGDVYQVLNTAASAADVTVLRSDNGFTGSDGLFFFKPQSGTEYMYYINGTQIGRWDISGTYPTGWTDNHFTGLQSTAVRATHKFNGSVYYTNKDRIGQVYDNAGTAANSTNVLDFESDYISYDIIDDGAYLVIAANNGQETKLYFWDTFSPSWNLEYTIHEPDAVTSLQRVGNAIRAISASGIYEFNFDNGPVKLRSNVDAPGAGNSKSKAIINEAAIFGGIGELQSYGSLKRGAPQTFFKPFRIPPSLATQITSILAYNESKIFAACNGRLFKFVPTSYGVGSGLTANFRTRFVDLGDTYNVTKVVFIVGLKYGGNTTHTVALYKDTDYSTAFTYTQDVPTDANLQDYPQKMSFFPTNDGTSGKDGFITDYLALKYTIASDNAQAYLFIKRIDIYGEPSDYSYTKLY